MLCFLPALLLEAHKHTGDREQERLVDQMMTTVVSASVGALAPLLVKLAALLVGEYGRLKGVRGEIISLECELRSMHAAVEKYMMLEDPDVQVKEWVSIVRELAYNIEDCVDRFIHKLGRSRRHGGFKEFFGKTARQVKQLKHRHRIADQIDELKVRIKQVKELKSSYKLDDIACSTSSHVAVDPRLCAYFAEEANLVGVDGPRDNLVEWMMQGENSSAKNRKVLSIVGFGGLGKTTLAKEVYRKIQDHFDCRAFVSVSQKPDIRKIFKDVISQVSCQDESVQDTNNWDEKKYITKLRQLLEDKRYLIVIDDIWSTPAWDAIRCAFPENNCSCRIIVTTRIIGVARSCCMPGGDDRMHEMKALNDPHSKSLFFKRIFGPNGSCPDMLNEVANEILKKCGGLPLAIISISGLLSNIPAAKYEWEKVKRSIGSAMDKDRYLEGMTSILSLSYNILPQYLKTCLLYLSIFPEDYVIERERLVRRWIAEGFISEERGQSRQEVAENYFYELINKSMVQPVDIGYDGKARACRVHDMMLEIIISKSAEENFTTIIGNGQTSLVNHHGFIRRLSVQHIDQELATALANEDLSHVRSLTVTTSGCMRHLPSLDKFEVLRVLDFEDCGSLDEYNMNSLDKLFQLNYLNLRGSGISTPPPGIAMLHDLETLDLRGTYVQELPTRTIQLMKLEHLLASGETKIPNGIENMGSLRVISGFNITLSSVDAVKDLGNLSNLNQLDVVLDGEGSEEHKKHEDTLMSSLCKLGSNKLQSLKITRYGGPLEFLTSWTPHPISLQIFNISSDHHLMEIPPWIVPELTNLAYLDINLAELREQGLQSLGKLPALLCLAVQLKSDPEERLTVKGTGFPSLKKFVLYSEGGAYVVFARGAMPRLEKFEVRFHVSIAKADGFYLGIEHLPCLKQVRAWLYNKGATTSESKAAAALIRDEAGAHPNRPTVRLLGDRRP